MKYLKDIGCILLAITTILAFIFTGCNSSKRCEKRLTKIEMKCPGLFQPHDTTIYKRHDTVIYYHDIVTTPEITHIDTFNIPCPDHTTVTKHFKGGSATISIQKGQIIVQCHEDSLKLVISRKDSVITNLIEKDRSGLATRTITVPAPPTSWQGFCKWFTWIVLIGAGGYLGVKLFPKI